MPNCLGACFHNELGINDEILANLEMNRLLGSQLFAMQVVHQYKVNWRPIGQEHRTRFLIFFCLRPEKYRRKSDERP